MRRKQIVVDRRCGGDRRVFDYSANIPERRKRNRAITADTALCLGRFFKMSPHFWLNLQNRFDLEVTEDQFADRLDKEIQAINTDVAYRKLNRDFIESAEGTD
jgi:hypothetical protein